MVVRIGRMGSRAELTYNRGLGGHGKSRNGNSNDGEMHFESWGIKLVLCYTTIGLGRNSDRKYQSDVVAKREAEEIFFGKDWEKEESGKILESRGRVQGNI